MDEYTDAFLRRRHDDDRQYYLNDVREAFEYADSARTVGNVLLEVSVN